MIGEFRATLYDLFGFLLPGFTLTVALFLALAMLRGPGTVIDLDAVSGTTPAVLLGVLSYLLGHLVQVVGNLVPVLRGPDSTFIKDNVFPAALTDAAALKMSALTGVTVKQLPPADQYALMDEYRAVTGKIGDREVFVYREGFYRGMVVSTSALAVVGAVALRTGLPCVAPPGIDTAVCASRGQTGFMLALAIVAVGAFFQRRRRFGWYRVQRAIYGALVAAPSKESKTAPDYDPE